MSKNSEAATVKPTASIKLRSACNQCHFSKVRCSGEKTGCTRCLSLGHSCIYVESRVGKVQGNRGRRRRTQSENDQPPPPPPSLSSLATNIPRTEPGDPAFTPVSITPVNSTPVPEMEQDGAFEFEDYLLSELNNHGHGHSDGIYAKDSTVTDECPLPIEYEDLPSIGTPLGSMHHHQPSHSSDMGTHPVSSSMSINQEMQCDLVDPCQKSPFSPFFMRKDDATSLLGTQHHQFKHYRQSIFRRMVECVELVDGLEHYIHIRLMAADEVLRINKCCMTTVLSVLLFEETNPSMSLLGLICLILNHTVTLSESASAHLLSQASKCDKSGTHIPSIQFGNFLLDPEDNVVIQTRIFTKELERCSQIAEKLASRIQLINEDRGNLGKVYMTWHTDLQTRLQILQNTMK